MNYQEEAFKQALHQVDARLSDKTAALRAKEMVKYMNDRGWRLTRDDHTQEYVSEGPIQRALGLDSGDGF